MREEVEEYVRTCLVCQQDKVDHQKQAGLFLVYIKWILRLDKSRDRILERIDRMLVSEEQSHQ